LHQIQQELAEYFAGMLRVFKTPVRLLGTDFQQATWRALQTIPCGETRSYAEVANIAGKPGASRALGNANGANRLTIIVPCHRVIQGNGTLGGYSSGLDRKKWLLAHEGCIGFS
jgi:AraC family transcriptional regulator of adaptative response/methylated-DNA-[protein]-cysteine methyltransferase